MKCENCKWFELTEPERPGHLAYGLCHVSPPTTEGFPKIKASAWCSRYEDRVSPYEQTPPNLKKPAGQV